MGLDSKGLPDVESAGKQNARWWTPEQLPWMMAKSFKEAGADFAVTAHAEIAAFCERLNRGDVWSDRSMEDIVRENLPFMVAKLETTAAFAKEFPKFVAATQKSRDARVANPGLSYEEKLDLAQHLDELSASV